ncbi:MAG: hypothetical protein KAJ79_01975, partial [Candidatus Omnitrophica bacterium]|nr:hypothetical protein [Candidatus Omnitrophota bacterium]
ICAEQLERIGEIFAKQYANGAAFPVIKGEDVECISEFIPNIERKETMAKDITPDEKAALKEGEAIVSRHLFILLGKLYRYYFGEESASTKEDSMDGGALKNIGILNIKDYINEEKEIAAEKEVRNTLKEMGLTIYPEELDIAWQLICVEDQDRNYIYEFLDHLDDKNGITLFLTGGAFSICVFKAFTIAVFYALYIRNVPIHIVLVEDAIADGNDCIVRNKYENFIKTLPVNTIISVDGVVKEDVFIKTKDYYDAENKPYLSRSFSVRTSFYSTVDKFKEHFSDSYQIVAGSMRPDDYQAVKRVVKKLRIPEEEITEVIASLIETTETAGTSQPQVVVNLIKLLSFSRILKDIKNLDEFICTMKRIEEFMFDAVEQDDDWFRAQAITALNKLIVDCGDILEQVEIDGLLLFIRKAGDITKKAGAFQFKAIAALNAVLSSSHLVGDVSIDSVDNLLLKINTAEVNVEGKQEWEVVNALKDMIVSASEPFVRNFNKGEEEYPSKDGGNNSEEQNAHLDSLLARFRTRDDVALLLLKVGSQGWLNPVVTSGIVTALSRWYYVIEALESIDQGQRIPLILKPEEVLNWLRDFCGERSFRVRKIKEVIDTLKQSGEIEYYRAIYLEKINEIQQGQPLDVQTKWSNEKRKGLDGGKGVVETSGKRGWLVVDKMVLTGWWDFTKVLNKIKLYRDIDLTKYGIEGVLNLSKSLESKTIEIIEDEEEVTENIDFDFSIEGNGNVLIEADTYRQLYLMYPDMVVYGILRQVLPYELRKLGIKDNIIKKIMVDNFGRSSVEEGALMTQLDDDLYLYKAAKCDVSHSDQKVLKILEARDKVLIDRFKTLIKELGGFERIFNMETSEFIVLLSEISNYTIKEITVTQIEDFIRVLSSKGWSFELIHYRGIPFSSKQYMAAYDDNVIKAFEDVYGQEAVAILGIGKGDDISFVKEYMDKECGFIKTPFLHEVLEKISLNYGLVDPLCAEVSGHSNLATIKATLYFAYHMNELKEVVDTIGLRGEAFSEAERRMRDSIIQLYENANEKLMKARAEKRINVFRDGGEKTGGVNGKVLMEEQSAWRRLVKDALDNCTLRSNEKYCKENHPDNFTTFIQRLKIGSHSGVLQNMLWLIEVDFSLFLEYKRITEELLPKVNDLLELYSNDIIVMEKFIKNRNVLVFWGRYVPFHTDKNVGIVPVNEIKKINGETISTEELFDRLEGNHGFLVFKDRKTVEEEINKAELRDKTKIMLRSMLTNSYMGWSLEKLKNAGEEISKIDISGDLETLLEDNLKYLTETKTEDLKDEKIKDIIRNVLIIQEIRHLDAEHIVFKKCAGLLNLIYQLDDKQNVKQIFYESLKGMKKNLLEFENLGRALLVKRQIVISGLSDEPNEQILSKIKEMLKRTANEEKITLFIYTPRFLREDIQDKIRSNYELKVNGKGELELKRTKFSETEEANIWKDVEAVEKLRELGFVGEDNLILAEKGDRVFGDIAILSVVANIFLKQSSPDVNDGGNIEIESLSLIDDLAGRNRESREIPFKLPVDLLIVLLLGITNLRRINLGFLGLLFKGIGKSADSAKELTLSLNVIDKKDDYVDSLKEWLAMLETSPPG